MSDNSTSTSSYVEGPRHAVVTADDVGPIITIVTLFLMVVMILTVALRLLVRIVTSHVPGADDVVISVAVLMALGEVIATTLGVNRGLGTRFALLNSDQQIQVQKGLYASELLYIMAIALAKASTLLLLQRLTITRPHKLVGRILAGILVAWTLAAMFGLSFQCDLPNAWAILSDKCFDVLPFWDTIGAIDILLDVLLVVMPMWIIWNLKMSWRRKIFVILGFGFRLILCASQIIRLSYLHKYAAKSDTLYSSLGFILATQFETMFAIVAASIPALKPFMDRVASGLIGVSFHDREGTYAMGSINKTPRSGSRSKPNSDLDPRRGLHNSNSNSRNRSLRMDALSNGDYHAEIAASNVSHSRSMAHHSIHEDSRHVAHKTVEWEVRYSDEERLNDKSSWIDDRPSEERDSAAPNSSVSTHRSVGREHAHEQ